MVHALIAALITSNVNDHHKTAVSSKTKQQMKNLVVVAKSQVKFICIISWFMRAKKLN